MGSVFPNTTVPRAGRFPNFFEMSASIGFEFCLGRVVPARLCDMIGH